MVEEVQEGCCGVEKIPVSSFLDTRGEARWLDNSMKLLPKNKAAAFGLVILLTAPQAPQEKLLNEACYHQGPGRCAACLRGSRCLTGEHRTRLPALGPAARVVKVPNSSSLSLTACCHRWRPGGGHSQTGSSTQDQVGVQPWGAEPENQQR